MNGILYRIINKKRSSLYKRQYYCLLVMLHLVYILYPLFYSGGLPALSYAILFATTLLRANYLSNNSTTAPITVFRLKFITFLCQCITHDNDVTPVEMMTAPACDNVSYTLLLVTRPNSNPPCSCLIAQIGYWQTCRHPPQCIIWY